ncbi:MAG: endo-1,4-beta-xylanase [Planctomycetota bacterium]
MTESLKRRHRVLACGLERLESRHLLAGSLGDDGKFDVNADGQVTAMDALQVINLVNAGESSPSHDVNSDGDVSALDALQIINHLNTVSAVQAVSEPTPSASVVTETQVRQRDITELTIQSVQGIDPSSVNNYVLDWGDGSTEPIDAAGLSFPISRWHAYFDSPQIFEVSLTAVHLDGSSTELAIDNPAIEVLASSPEIADRVQQGLTAEVFSTVDLTGSPTSIRTDPTISFDFGVGGPDASFGVDAEPFSIRWSGSFTPQRSGTHRFFVDVGATDTASLFVEGNLLVSSTGGEALGTIELMADQPVSIEVRYSGSTDGSRIQVGTDNDDDFKVSIPSWQFTPSSSLASGRSGVLLEEFSLGPVNSITDLRRTAAFIENTPIDAEDLTEAAFQSEPTQPSGFRLRGIVSPPVSGRYQFHLAAGGEAELWLSQGLASENGRRIATVTTPTNPGDLADENAGVSEPIYLVAGQSYYLEALHVDTDATHPAHLSIGWTRPDQIAAGPQVLTDQFVRPIVPVVTIQSEISQTAESIEFATGTRMVVSRSDDLGRDLTVGYTIGGSATNGIDFTSLTGTIVIPKGERSATLEIQSLEDSIAEDDELSIIRLVADPAYQLGSEFERQVINTIADDTVEGTDLLPNLAVLQSSYSFASIQSPNTVTDFSVTDPELPFAVDPASNNAIRVDVQSFANPWDVSFTHILPEATDFNQGDRFFALVWARGSRSDGGAARLGMRFQERSNFQGIDRTWQLTDAWQPYFFPIEVSAELAGPGPLVERSIDLRLGYHTQTVELAEFRLLRLPAGVDFSGFPKTVHSYLGRDVDAAWRDQADVDARRLRTRPVMINVVDANGDPVEGAVVTITPQSNALPIGTTVSVERFYPETTLLAQSDDSARFRAILESGLFDHITDAGNAQWGPWENAPDPPRDFLQWVVDQDLPYHGHSLVWGEFSQGGFNFPTPDSLLVGYEAELAESGEPAAIQWLKDQILAHVEVTGPAADFKAVRDDGTPQVTWWDVVNHPIFTPEIWDLVGSDFMAEVFEAARRAAGDQTKLVINEFEILSNPDFGNSDDFIALISNLDQTATSGRADIDVIGLQSHFVSDRLPSIDRMMSELGRYQELDREIKITEFDIDAVDIDQQTQADFTRDFFELLSATDQVTAATMWGFWAGDHWREQPGREEAAALFNEDWTARPNGQWLVDSREREASLFTSGAADASISLSSGKHRIEIEFEGHRTVVQLDSWNVSGIFNAIIPVAPIARDDSLKTVEDTPIIVDLLVDNGSGADADIGGSELLLQSIGTASNGTVEVLNGREVRYTPTQGFVGTDTFVYEIQNESGISSQAVVSVSVEAFETATQRELVAHYTFDGLDVDDTTVPDTSPFGFDNSGTLIGNAVIEPAGSSAGSLRITGPDSLLEIPDSFDINLAELQRYSISFWFLAEDLASPRQQILYEQGGGIRGLSIYLDSGRLVAGGWNQDEQESGWLGTWLKSDTLSPGWHHVAVTLDGSTSVQENSFEMWLDGTLVGSGPGSQLWRHSNDVAIGRLSQNARLESGAATEDDWFAGWVDDFRIYHTKIDSDAVQVLASTF